MLMLVSLECQLNFNILGKQWSKDDVKIDHTCLSLKWFLSRQLGLSKLHLSQIPIFQDLFLNFLVPKQ